MRSVVEDFVHRPGGHCGSGALRDVLEHRGLDYGAGPLSEGAVFGLGAGLGAFYIELPEMTPPIYLVGRTGDLERDIAVVLDAELDVLSTDDPDEGWEWVASEVDAGQPIMVWADIAKLDYLRVKLSNTRHDVLVVGYDEEEGVAYIADNDRDELQACSLDSLAAARNSDGFPGPNRHTTFLYDWPAQLPDPEAAVASALLQTILNMRAEPDTSGSIPGPTGLAAIDAFAAGYPQWPSTFGQQLGEALRGLSLFIIKAGTGGAMFRSLHQEFLADFAALLGSEPLADAVLVYEELSDTWVELAQRARDGDHAGGLELVERIRALEHEGVAAMEAAA